MCKLFLIVNYTQISERVTASLIINYANILLWSVTKRTQLFSKVKGQMSKNRHKSNDQCPVFKCMLSKAMIVEYNWRLYCYILNSFRVIMN